MIKIICTKKDNHIVELSIKGHANSDEYGKDLVCAAVTAISVGGCNALNEENFFIVIKEGEVLIKAIKDIDSNDEIALNTIYTQLKAVAEGQKEYVTISERNE